MAATARGRICAAVNFICIDTPKNVGEIKRRWRAELSAAARQIRREVQELDDLIL